MAAFPQLRVRTEFSFPRKAYGPLDKVVARLVELGAPLAGMVNANGGTWGHAKFEKKMLEAGLEPAYGAEFIVKTSQGESTAWVLGETTRALYEFASGGPRQDEVHFADTQGLIRFAGGALTAPETFDYVDIGPRSPLAQRKAIALAKATKKPLALVSDNLCPSELDMDIMRAVVDREAIGIQWLADKSELRTAMPLLTNAQFNAACRGTMEVAERLKGVRIPKAPLIQLDGDLRKLCLAGKKSRLARGHIGKWTPEYAARLKRELDLIKTKEFESYFLMVCDLVRWAKKRMLVGPARGSSAGSLVCYLLDITEVDPLRHHLLFERFVDLNRDDLPDIDIDFSDTKRDMVFEYLVDKYGRDKVARIGSINTFKPASVLAQLGKRLGISIGETFAVKNVLIEYSSGDSRYGKGLQDTLQQTEPGRRFVSKYPALEELVQIEGHATHTGVHAAGVLVCNEPITNFCTVNEAGVAQIDKPDAEYLNLLKIDVLGLRTLGIIEDAGCATSDELYALTLDDPAVLEIFNERKMAGVFQFEGSAQRSVSSQINFTSFTQLDHVTALARPGPLGGGAANHYILRAAGKEPIEYRHPTMKRYLEDTLGIVLYQEQVMRIVRELGNFSWGQTTTIRKAMSGRKGAEYFDQMREQFTKGAKSKGISAADAEGIWQEIFTFGAWGMNKSHTVSYAIISYWCAWMKRYHPLEYAAATLRSAKDDEQVMDFLREMHAEGVEYVALDPELSGANWSAKDGRLVGGLRNAAGFGPAKAAAYIAARDAGTLTDKARAKLTEAAVKFTDLFPMHTAYGDWYADPQAHNIRAGWTISQIAELEDNQEAIVICRLLKKEQRDENESLRAKKRNGKLLKGNTIFADLKVVDDSTSLPITVRVDRFNWTELGEDIINRAVEGKDCFLVRGKKIPGFPMIKVNKIKCLTNPEINNAPA